MPALNNEIEFKKIPIYIISFNRLKELHEMIARLEQDGYTNLCVLDNASTDEKLLEYLHGLPYKVYFLTENYGHMVFWKCGLFDEVMNSSYYVVSDPDILPSAACPDDYVEIFYRVLQEYPQKTKAGFSLILNDIPDCFQYKMDVIRWESFFYDHKLSDSPLLFDADIDTTFALYRPGRIADFYAAVRVGQPYEARHLGWYINTIDIPKADAAYMRLGKQCGGSFFFDDKVSQLRFAALEKLRVMQMHMLYGDMAAILQMFCSQYKQIFIYGAGNRAESLANIFHDSKLQFAAFLVSHSVENKSLLFNHPVQQIDRVDIDKENDGIVLGMSLQHELNVMHILYENGYKNILHL